METALVYCVAFAVASLAVAIGTLGGFLVHLGATERDWFLVPFGVACIGIAGAGVCTAAFMVT